MPSTRCNGQHGALSSAPRGVLVLERDAQAMIRTFEITDSVVTGIWVTD